MQGHWLALSLYGTASMSVACGDTDDSSSPASATVEARQVAGVWVFQSSDKPSGTAELTAAAHVVGHCFFVGAAVPVFGPELLSDIESWIADVVAGNPLVLQAKGRPMDMSSPGARTVLNLCPTEEIWLYSAQ